jgi:hypothetical protein
LAVADTHGQQLADALGAGRVLTSHFQLVNPTPSAVQPGGSTVPEQPQSSRWPKRAVSITANLSVLARQADDRAADQRRCEWRGVRIVERWVRSFPQVQRGMSGELACSA